MRYLIKHMRYLINYIRHLINYIRYFINYMRYLQKFISYLEVRINSKTACHIKYVLETCIQQNRTIESIFQDHPV